MAYSIFLFWVVVVVISPQCQSQSICQVESTGCTIFVTVTSTAPASEFSVPKLGGAVVLQLSPSLLAAAAPPPAAVFMAYDMSEMDASDLYNIGFHGRAPPLCTTLSYDHI